MSDGNSHRTSEKPSQQHDSASKIQHKCPLNSEQIYIQSARGTLCILMFMMDSIQDN
jgi:hypothetical protein